MSPLASLGLLLAAFIAGYLGFACLALTQSRHWRDVLGPDDVSASPPRLVLRIAGGLLIGISLALAFWRDGASFGALLWGTVISVNALAVVVTLTWQARWLRLIAGPLAAAAQASASTAPRRHDR